jgi:enoyl-[acyl-carrier protein] reductase II
MKKNRICDLLGIQYPIIQGGMLWLATPELAAAVSEAGALGVISPFAGMEEHGDPTGHIHILIKRVRSLTEKPFGVNLPLDLEQSGVLIDLIIRQRVGIVITAAGNPAHYTALLKQQGIKVLHVISSVKQAQKAVISKVDAIIAEGVEAAGHSGFDQLPLFSLIPQVVDAISIPVVAAGGIVDGRGLVAAMALGAEGVLASSRRRNVLLIRNTSRLS